MVIRAEDEQRFYDRQYSRFLSTPEADLAITRASLEADLRNPAKPVYERRRLFERTLAVLLAHPVNGLRVLDYGCGTGDWGLMLATEGAEVTLLDLSPVAIEIGLRRARASGVAARVNGVARDASDLSCFPDAEFDLVFASAAIHHTLKYPNAMAELVRVLKPGGRLVLAETYGNNPILNGLRRLGWKLRAQPDEAGEDILFGRTELDALRRHFREVRVEPLNLFAMAKRLFRGRYTNPLVRAVLFDLELTDRILLRACPPLRRYCGEVVVVATK